MIDGPSTPPPVARATMLDELGLRCSLDGPALRGEAIVPSGACIPGTDVVRTSVVATWADVMTGLLTLATIAPRGPATLDLEVHLVEPLHDGDVVDAVATVVRAGRTVVVLDVRFARRGHPGIAALATASYVASPNPDGRPPNGFDLLDATADDDRPELTVDFATRASCRTVAPGVVEVPRSPDGLNALGAIQGGLLALAAEEAAASLTPGPTLATSLSMRFLRPVLVGPARAGATRFGPVATVEVTDAESGKPAALATARLTTIAEGG